MANQNKNVSVESVIHGAFKEVAQIIMDQHGVTVSSVSFDWLAGAAGGGKPLCNKTQVVSSK